MAELEAASSTSVLREVLPRLRAALGLDAIVFAVPVERTTGWALERLELDGFANPTRARRVISDHFARSADPVPWIDLRRPSEEQRNRVVEPIATLGREPYASSAFYERVAVPLGLHHHDVVRVLVCDGATLLGWLGGFSMHAIDPETSTKLGAFASALQHRLRTERLLDAAPHLLAALSTTLEQIPAAALVVDWRGQIYEANGAARTLLEEQRDEVSSSFSALFAKQRATIPFVLTRIPGGDDDPRFLAVLRPRTQEARLSLAIDIAAHRWKLTKRQQQVLKLLVRGESNAAIARALGITDRAAELHITALFDRARVSNRAGLIAAVLLGS